MPERYVINDALWRLIILVLLQLLFCKRFIYTMLVYLLDAISEGTRVSELTPLLNRNFGWRSAIQSKLNSQVYGNTVNQVSKTCLI